MSEELNVNLSESDKNLIQERIDQIKKENENIALEIGAELKKRYEKSVLFEEILKIKNKLDLVKNLKSNLNMLDEDEKDEEKVLAVLKAVKEYFKDSETVVEIV